MFRRRDQRLNSNNGNVEIMFKVDKFLVHTGIWCDLHPLKYSVGPLGLSLQPFRRRSLPSLSKLDIFNGIFLTF